MSLAQRTRVLSLYRRLLQLSHTWESLNPKDNQKERNYIKQETKYLFRKNKNITNDNDIEEHIQEGVARMELAIHYKIPYPRPMNFPQTVLSPKSTKRSMKKQDEILKLSKSIYVKSLYDKER